MAESEAKLVRALGPVQVTAGGVGIIVGAGIYVLIGEASAEAGGAVWASFLLAAALCAFTGLSYAELSSAYPSVASEYDYTRRAFPEWVAFLVGWVMLVALIAAAATVSLGFGRYVDYFFDVDVTVTALCLLGALFVLSATGIRQAGAVILLLSGIQIAGLLAVIAIGLPSFGDHSLTETPGAAGIIGGAALVFFAFIGFDEVITLGEETHDPARTVPRALLVALAISTALYIFTAIAAVSAIGADALASSDQPLADVVAKVAGSRSGEIIAVAALISTTNTTLLALTAASRMLYGMANLGAMPAWLGRVNRRTRVPLRSTTLVCAGAVGLALAADLKFLAQVTDLSIYLVFLSVNTSLVVLRFRDPDAERPFRSPLSIGRVPLLPFAGILSVFVLVTGLELEAVGAATAVCAVGLVLGLGVNARSPVRQWLRGTGGRGE